LAKSGWRSLSALANRIWRAKAREFAEGAAVPHYFGHPERILAVGPENLTDYELPEVILFAARPQGYVKPVAKALIEHFGGLVHERRVRKSVRRRVPRNDGLCFPLQSPCSYGFRPTAG
jgi:hypothetical protein